MNENDRRIADRRVFLFIAVSIVGMLALNIVSTRFVKGWEGAGFNTALVSLIYLVYAIRARNPMLTNWLVASVVAGFVELLADRWLVLGTQTLVYDDGPLIVVSPIYMPFAWMLVIVQVAIIGQWFAHRCPKPLAALLTATLAGLNIPFYECLAKVADWWYYQDTPMILGAPYYIILGEFLIGLPLVYLGVWLHDRVRIGAAVAAGVFVGLVIYAAYGVSWWLVG